MKHRISAIAVLLLVAVSPFTASSTGLSPRVQAVLDTLDHCLAQRGRYMQAVAEQVYALEDSLVRTDDPQNAVALSVAIGDAFSAVSLDSAIMHYNSALKIGGAAGLDALSGDMLDARVKRNALMPFSGIVHEAIVDFEKIDRESLVNDVDRKIYYRGVLDFCLHTMSLYPEGDVREEYRRTAIAYCDSLISLMDSEGVAARFVSAYKMKLEGRNAIALADVQQLLPEIEGEYELSAKATNIIAEYYAGIPSKKDERIYYLTLSAINDLKSGRREVASMQRLGKELYEQGEVDLAYKYMTTALSDALSSGSRLRVLESTKDIPIISKAFRTHDARRFRWLLVLVVVLVVTLFVIICFVSVMRREHRKSEELRRHLAELNKSKDAYIQNILSLCSVFFERLEEFNRYVGRKIKTGQVKDLYDSIESRRYLTTQTEEFFKSFDSTFNTIHPNFCRNLNKLLKPDRRLPEPAEGQAMSPELRIAAFMRLGIDDSAILAKFLGLGVNTIYTYRNRLKNRAVDRETIEEDIKNIGI